ncbi:MAG: hypothetical protein APF77_12075 [Clostridia bacterium BRH_c25]|nr:MAG: hypothetical protein APF77_12075 [Clostridia bacterium BRH_c25]
MELKDFLPLPRLESCKVLLCIQPHPDDNEVGAGATIAKLTQAGCTVVYLTVSDGRLGTLNPAVNPTDLVHIRKKEAEESSKILGVSRSIFLDFEDASYPDEAELAKSITSVIREVKPEIVMTVDPFLPYEAHPDHRKVGQASAEACLFSSFPHFRTKTDSPEEVWNISGIAFYNSACPNTFVNVDDTWNLKFEALAAHKSQFDKKTLEQYKDYFDFKSRQYAEGRGFAHAEAFKLLTAAHLHCNTDTINL